MKHQRLIISLFFAAFFIIGGYLVLAARGYFIDWQKMTLVQTGGAFISYLPKDAALTINGQKYETSSFFLNNGNLIKKLKPGNYSLSLAKDKFFSWQKDFIIKPGLVTEFKKISLIPENPPKETLAATAVKKFWLTAEGPVYQNTKMEIYFENFRLPGATIAVSSPVSSLVILAKNSEFLITDLNKPTTVINLSQLFNSLKQRQLGLNGQVLIQKIFFHPFAKNEILIATRQSLYDLNLKQIKLTKIIDIEPEKIVGFSQAGLFFKNPKNNLSFYNLDLQKETAPAITISKIAQIKSDPTGKKIGVLDTAGQFFLFDSETEKTEKPAKDEIIKDFSFSPDEQYLALLTNKNTFVILNFKDEKPFDVELAAGTIVNKFDWLEDFSHYLLILNNGKIIMKDIFRNPPFNEYDLTENIIQFEATGKTIYLLDKNQTLSQLTLKQNTP